MKPLSGSRSGEGKTAKRAFVVLALIVFTIGCDWETGTTVAVRTGPQKPTQETVELVHDFGAVRPQSKHSHRFTIKNPTDSSWRLASTLSGCTCTIAKASADFIAPHGEMTVAVEYTAGFWASDERRTVTLRFHAPGPIVTLAVEGKIRPALAIVPHELAMHDKAILNVHNYSAAEWSELEVASDDDWLTIEKVEPVRLADGRPNTEPRQSWRILLRASFDDLKAGAHATRVRCRSDGFEEAVVVTIRVESPLRVIPPTLFFGTVIVGSTVERTLKVVAPGPLSVTHDLGEQVAVEVKGDLLKVRLSPIAPCAINGTLSIASGEFETSVAVRAIVREAAE